VRPSPADAAANPRLRRNAKRSNTPLSELNVESLAGPLADGTVRSAMETAVLKQSMRVVYLSAEVLDDIEAAGERMDAPQAAKTKAREDPPRPYIPGA
jgi:hypothetical protein